ncbi:hypothetical protein SYNPS1DRAFT_20198, partial [Syncephalis pseudoplumigaleata]
MHLLRPTKIALAAIACLFLGGAVHSGSSALVGKQCEGIRVRQNILDLTAQQRDALFRALRTLQSEPRPNSYDWFVKLHKEHQFKAHGNAHFLPWHRTFTRAFEQQLQRIDPSVTLPYWDWSVTSQAPEKHPVFSPHWFGGNGRPGDHCVTDGQFADWKPYYSAHNCLRRQFSEGSGIGALVSVEALRYLIDTSDDFATFNSVIEAPTHNLVHMGIGGEMVTVASPNDPIFFVHHTFIDMQWAIWQSRSERHARDYGGY